MAVYRKFLFDLDFGAPPPPLPDAMVLEDSPADGELAEEEEMPPATFSEEELSLAREQAFEAGRQDGIRQAEEETQRLLATSMAALSDGLRACEQRQAEADENRLKSAIAVVLSVARKLLPETAKNTAFDEITGVVRECLARIDEPVRVTVRVHSDAIEEVRSRAEEAASASAFEGKLVFVPDPRVAAGDCRVEWGDGGAERDQTRIWAEIEDIITRATAVDAAPAPVMQPE